MKRLSCKSQIFTVIAGLLMFVSGAADPVMAGSITYDFGGTINFVGNNLTNSLFHEAPPSNSGSTMTGRMKVDTTDGTSGGLVGTYTIKTFNLQVGSYHMTFNPTDGNTVTIRNGTGNGVGADRFLVTAGVDGTTVRPGSGTPGVFTMNLRGPSNIFSSDALPNPVPSSPSLGDVFTRRHEFRLQFVNANGNGGDGRAVTGDITSLKAVPLPPGAILFAIGLVALIGLGAGGLRNLRSPQA